MDKKVLVISASLRPGSNSHALAEQFAEGAREAGHEVELVSLRGREIQFCRGCTACQKTGSCVIRDDVARCWKSCAPRRWWRLPHPSIIMSCAVS